MCEARVQAGKRKVDNLILEAEEKGKLTFDLVLTGTEFEEAQKAQVLAYARSRQLVVNGTKRKHRYTCSLEPGDQQDRTGQREASACSSRDVEPIPPAKRTRRACTVLCSK